MNRRRFLRFVAVAPIAALVAMRADGFFKPKRKLTEQERAEFMRMFIDGDHRHGWPDAKLIKHANGTYTIEAFGHPIGSAFEISSISFEQSRLRFS